MTDLTEPKPAQAASRGGPSAQATLRFDISRRSDLPALAWALRHRAGAAAVDVLAGPHVRESAGVFWEGVNPCVDEPRAILAHHFPLASGAALRGEDVVAFTPGHTLDRLFVVRAGDTIYASNSLPFVLRASGTQLDPRCLNYHWTLGAIQSHRQTAALQGGELIIYHNTNVVISRDNRLRHELRPASPDFETYTQYRANLDAFLDEIVAAMKSPINRDYAPLSTISSGYDSPAATALARHIGGRNALTIVDSRAGPSDSGQEIADLLGVEVEGRSRTEYRAAGLEAERLFYFGGVANDIIFYPWKDTLRSKLLFTGYKGDMLWDRNWLRPLGTWSWDTDGATMIELRLRSGFVHLPPAFYGWRRSDRLLAISKSEEMAPWTLWNEYDRPIARRIVEEAGVTRDLFGQSKKMVTSTIGVDKNKFITLDDLGLSHEFRTLLSEHAREHGGAALALSFTANNGMHNLMRSAHGLTHAAKRGLARARPQRAAPAPTPQHNAPPSLADRVFFELEFQLPARRQFMAPFTELNFAAQVSNALLGADYQTF